MFLAVHVDAGNDVNGNPRRGTMITDSDGKFVNFLEHGYRGARQTLEAEGYRPHNHTSRYRDQNITEPGTLDITVRQYRSLIKQAEEVKTQA